MPTYTAREDSYMHHVIYRYPTATPDFEMEQEVANEQRAALDRGYLVREVRLANVADETQVLMVFQRIQNVPTEDASDE